VSGPSHAGGPAGRTVRQMARAGAASRRPGAAGPRGFRRPLNPVNPVKAIALAALTTMTALAAASVIGPAADPGSVTPAGAAPVARADASGGTRVTDRLPPGLSASEHAVLARAGAYGTKPVHLLLVGDSIAMTLGMGLSERSRPEYGVSVADDATVGCDLDPGLQIMTDGAPGPATPGCQDWRALWPFLAEHLHPQVVALGLGRWEVTDHLLDGQWVHIGEPPWDRHLTADLQGAISIFHGFGAKVVLFTMPYVDPSDRQPDGLPWSENTPSRARAYNDLVRTVARDHPGSVSVIDLNKMLSPGGSYAATVDGVPVRQSDGIHVSIAGGQLLQRAILPEIDRIGMEDEAAAKAGV
jgi:SGNH domain (fused to AT3 domains)